MTAVFIALQSEARKKARQDFEKEIPDAEILLPTPEATTSPASEIDTSNWKTYENEEYSFSFKYPSFLTIRENSFQSPSSKFNIALCESQPCTTLNSILTVNVVTNDFYQSNLENPSISIDEITLDDLKGVVKSFSYHEGTERVVFIKTDNKRFMIGGNEKNSDIFSQILSTFQFID